MIVDHLFGQEGLALICVPPTPSIVGFMARWQASTLIDKLYGDCDYAGQSTDEHGTSKLLGDQ